MPKIHAAPLETGADKPHHYEIWAHLLGSEQRDGTVGFRRIPLVGERSEVEATLKLQFGDPSMLQVLKALWGHSPEQQERIRLGRLVTASLVRVQRTRSRVQHELLTRDVWITPEGYQKAARVHTASQPEFGVHGVGRVEISKVASRVAVSARTTPAECEIYSQAIGIQTNHNRSGVEPVYALVHHMPRDPQVRLERLHVLSYSSGPNM